MVKCTHLQNVYQVLFPDGLNSLLSVNHCRFDFVQICHDLSLLVGNLNLLDFHKLLDLLRVGLLLLSLLLVFHLRKNRLKMDC